MKFTHELTAEEDGFGTASDRTLQTSYDADGRLRTQVDGLGNPATTRTGHGFSQRLDRDGHGVNLRSIYDSVKNPQVAYSDIARQTTRYVGDTAVTVLNRAGEIVPTWARNRGNWWR